MKIATWLAGGGWRSQGSNSSFPLMQLWYPDSRSQSLQNEKYLSGFNWKCLRSCTKAPKAPASKSEKSKKSGHDVITSPKWLLCLMDPAAQWFVWKKEKVFYILFFSPTIDHRKDWEDPQDKQRFSRAETRAQEDREEQAIRWYAWHKCTTYHVMYKTCGCWFS